MIKFSANLGFLWPEHSLPEAIIKAGDAGFQAVECHGPYACPAEEVKAALAQTGLSMLGINTRRGDASLGENGVAALPGRFDEACSYIDEAISYAKAIAAPNIHLMAGASDQGREAEQAFMLSVSYAARQAALYGMTILIEPLNGRDAPFYHLQSTGQAVAIIEAAGCNNVKLMFDCYHIQILQGDLLRRIKECLPYIGHIQIAAVPSRAEPHHGEVNYPWLLPEIYALGYQGYIGAEYRPSGPTDDSLGWMASYR